MYTQLLEQWPTGDFLMGHPKSLFHHFSPKNLYHMKYFDKPRPRDFDALLLQMQYFENYDIFRLCSGLKLAHFSCEPMGLKIVSHYSWAMSHGP